MINENDVTRDEIRGPESFGFNSWLSGIVLIAMGGIFLLNSTGLFEGISIAGLMMLFPAASMLGSAYIKYREAGRVTTAVTTLGFIGLIISVNAAIFLLDLDWGMLWPVQMVIIGLWMLTHRARAR